MHKSQKAKCLQTKISGKMMLQSNSAQKHCQHDNLVTVKLCITSDVPGVVETTVGGATATFIWPGSSEFVWTTGMVTNG